MRKIIIAVALFGVFAFALSGCCNSIMCSVKKAAAKDLTCDSSALKVKNVSSQYASSTQGNERYLQVDGCGKQASYACSPTNLKPKAKKKYREDVIEKQSRLDLKWRCENNSNVAHK